MTVYWIVLSLLLATQPEATGNRAPAASAPAGASGALERLNREFLAHVQGLGPEYALAAGSVTASWVTYRDQAPESFVPDALAVLFPAFRDALGAFDAGRYAEAARLLDALRGSADPYVAASARYLHVRALVALGLLEEAQDEMEQAAPADADIARYTPYAAHWRFLLAYCQTSNLKFDEASKTLATLGADFPDAAEPVQVGARQLRLELERRERGTLDEVAAIMGYSAARLQVDDATTRVQSRQDEAVALLDKLIQDTEQREKQQRQSSARRQGSGQPQGQPRSAAEQSELPAAAAGEIGDQHAAPRADPGEMWGKLPPAEREKILQSLRDRFPSRYRQLVEQYYRSLAQEK